MILTPWVTYLVAEGLELSGIVSVLCCGIFLSQYATPNLRHQSKRLLKYGYETAAYSAETLVFIFLGIGLFAIDHKYSNMTIQTVFMTLLNLNIARMFNIFITEDDMKLSLKHKLVMILSGLRGAMAYALSLQSAVDFENGGDMLIITLIYALFTILMLGSIMNPIFTKCDLKRK